MDRQAPDPKRSLMLIFCVLLLLVGAATACMSSAASALPKTATPNILPPMGARSANAVLVATALPIDAPSSGGQQVAYAAPVTANLFQQNLNIPVNFAMIRDVIVPDCNTVLQYGIPAGANWWISGRVAERVGCRISVGDSYTDITLSDGMIYSVTIMTGFARSPLAQVNPNRYLDCNSALAGAAYYLNGVRLGGALEYAIGCQIFQTDVMKLIALDDGRAVFFSVSR